MLSEDYDGAISIMEPIAMASTEEPQYWLFLVNAYLQQDESDKAAEILEFMRHADIVDISNLVLLGNIYTNEQDYTLALDVYEQVLEQDKTEVDPSIVLDASNLFVRYGAFDQASSLLEQIEDQFNDVLEVEERLMLLGLNAQVATSKGEVDEAAALYERILELDPSDGSAMVELARYYSDKEDFARAYLYLDRAEKFAEHQVAALRLRGQLLVREGRFRDAIDPLERAVGLSTNDAINRRLENYIAQVKRAAGID
jgi:tetratricopeptide (TPR) repeat protein